MYNYDEIDAPDHDERVRFSGGETPFNQSWEDEAPDNLPWAEEEGK